VECLAIWSTMPEELPSGPETLLHQRLMCTGRTPPHMVLESGAGVLTFVSMALSLRTAAASLHPSCASGVLISVARLEYCHGGAEVLGLVHGS
jgi:hypothetical protein